MLLTNDPTRSLVTVAQANNLIEKDADYLLERLLK